MYHIIYNPISGEGKALKAFEIVTSYLREKNLEFDAHPTERKAHATEIVTALNKEEEINVIAIGGDGTFSEVLNGIGNFEKINLGLIPCGTGNDFARAAKLPTDPHEAIAAIVNGTPKYTDFLQVDGGRRCLNVSGAGMDVDVLVRYAEMKHFSGKLRYYLALFDVLLHLRFHKVRITLDGKASEKNVFLIAVANGIYIGGGMPISPKSQIDDGYLDVVVVNEIKKHKVLPLLLKFLSGGKHVNEPCTECYKVKEVEVEILDESKTQIDGEVLETKALSAKIITGALKLFR